MIQRWLSLFLVPLLLCSCARRPAVAASALPETALPAPRALKTGLGTVVSVAGSQNATPDFPGFARTDLTLAALTLDEEGVIRQCVLDGVTAIIPFDATGALQSPADLTFHSKNELGELYGMHKASPMGREWDQQAAAFAAYAVGRRAEELQPGDVTASVTVNTDGFVEAIRAAAEEADWLGAREGDELALAVLSSMEPSRSANGDTGEEGMAVTGAAAAAVTFRSSRCSSCLFRRSETDVPVTAQGKAGTQRSSRSGGTPQWTRSARDYAARITGKTVQEARHLPAPGPLEPAAAAQLRELVDQAWQQLCRP